MDLCALRSESVDATSAQATTAATTSTGATAVAAKANKTAVAAAAAKKAAAKSVVGQFGGTKSAELQGLYKVKGLHRDLSQPCVEAAEIVAAAAEGPDGGAVMAVPKFGVVIPSDKEEELAEVSRCH